MSLRRGEWGGLVVEKMGDFSALLLCLGFLIYWRCDRMFEVLCQAPVYFHLHFYGHSAILVSFWSSAALTP